MSIDFSPIDTYQRAFKYWWLVVALVLAGGLVGFGISRTRPPLYEARLRFTISIDFARTGALEDAEIDRAMESVGDILDSTQIITGVVSNASSQGIHLDPAGLKGMIFRERTAFDWIIRVRNLDPSLAAKLANLWGDQAMLALQEASEHAIRAGVLQNQLDSLTTCLLNTVASEPAQATCQAASQPEIQEGIAKVASDLKSEALASKGMMPGLAYHWSEKAEVPSKPVLFQEGQLILAGSVVGLMLAVMLLQSGFVQLLDRKISHA